jgi:signal transduction histidine kinase
MMIWGLFLLRPAMTSSSKAIAGFALIILSFIGMLSFWSEVRSEEDRGLVRHTYMVVGKLQDVRIDITQAETGQRGYLLTGQDAYLQLYGAGVSQVRQDMDELGELIADNPVERAAIKRLDPLIAARLAELGDGIEVRESSGLLAGVEAVTRANDGEKWMGQIAVQIGEMRHTEDQLLSGRLDAAAASTRKIKVVIVYGNALAILILLAKGFVIHRQAGKRNLAEQNLKQANEWLERRTSELSETNIELESFAYSVAHDLRAPLRQIAGYSNVLVQDYGPRFDAEGLRLLGKIEECAHRMGVLVDDLLNLSKIGRQKLSIQDTPLDSLLKQVVEDLAPECEGREIEWRIGELSKAECDPVLMHQVFVNLLSNAVKYTGKRERAVIQVGQMGQNAERVIFVRDNGVGFDMQYAGKLFGVFQRLHKARDFEGTGVGLAIVQRIIRKHGGRIWAEAEIDQGATFFFTIGSPERDLSNQVESSVVEEDLHVARS